MTLVRETAKGVRTGASARQAEEPVLR